MSTGKKTYQPNVEGPYDIVGDKTFEEDLTVEGEASFDNPVTVPTPVADTDAVSKAYVDDATEKESIASDNLRTSDDAQVALTGDLLKRKEILFNNPSGVVRISFTLGETASSTASGRIYINGSAAGASRSTTGSDSFVEDLDVSEGDLIQLYGNASSGNVSDFRLSYDTVVKHIEDTVN